MSNCKRLLLRIAVNVSYVFSDTDIRKDVVSLFTVAASSLVTDLQWSFKYALNKGTYRKNLVVWLLTTLLTGFGAGMGAYRTIQEIGGLQPVSKSKIEDLQEEKGKLEASLFKAAARIDSLKNVVDALRDSLTKTVSSDETGKRKPARSANTEMLSGLKNIRVVIIHLPSQVDVATRLASQIEKKGAIASTRPVRFDRSYWSIIIKKDSDDGLVAAALLKSLFPGLGVLPIRQKMEEEEPNDVVIWLSSDYR